MVKAVTEHEHYLTRVFAVNNELIVDESAANGGQGKGLSPMELLAASLASCTSITLRMYADRKQWNVGTIDVSVSIEKEPEIDATRFERKISFSETLGQERLDKLLDIADKCPVHKILTKASIVNTTL